MAEEKKEETTEEEKETKAATEKKAEDTPKKVVKPSADKKTGSTKKTTKTKPEKAVVPPSDEGSKNDKGKRAEKVGIVWSDKMDKTVVVRVERLFKHQLYHKYIKKRKKFMAHNELGASMGDRVRIQETRPLSARKRWRVVEIIQKAEK